MQTIKNEKANGERNEIGNRARACSGLNFNQNNRMKRIWKRTTNEKNKSGSRPVNRFGTEELRSDVDDGKMKMGKAAEP